MEGGACPHSLVAIYQLDFVMPGMRPSAANVRKQMRHMPNFLMYALGRPQIRHRLWNRTLNLGARFHRSIADFFAKILYLFYLFRNGMPSCASSERPSSSVFAVVTMETSRPRSLSIWS